MNVRRKYEATVFGVFLLLGCTAMMLVPFSPWTKPVQAAQNIYGLRCNPEIIFAGTDVF